MPEVLKRPAPQPTATDDSAPRDEALRERVRTIIEDVRVRGDEAVREHSQLFDGWAPESFRLRPDEIERIVATVGEQALAIAVCAALAHPQSYIDAVLLAAKIMLLSRLEESNGHDTDM